MHWRTVSWTTWMTTTTTTAAVAVDDHGAYSRSNTRIEYTDHEVGRRGASTSPLSPEK